ncbi:Uncharacterised protein [Bordetella pertussis]|nr:Uncharacterised protein [Bordetella pertussis]
MALMPSRSSGSRRTRESRRSSRDLGGDLAAR